MGRKGKVEHDLEALSTVDSPVIVKALWRGSQAQYDAKDQTWKDDDTIVKLINNDPT